MTTLLTMVFVIGYPLIGGVANALFRHLYPLERQHDDGFEHGAAAVFWPITLPAVLSYALAKRAFCALEAKREAEAKEAADLKRRVDELDEELRVAKGKT